MSPHGGTAQPFSLWVLGTLGHNRQHCWGTDGTRHRTDGSVPDRQPRGRGPLALGWSLGTPSAGSRLVAAARGEQAPPAVGGAGTAGPVGIRLGRGWTRV